MDKRTEKVTKSARKAKTFLEFEINDRLMVKDYRRRSNTKWEKAVITKKIGNAMYLLVQNE